MTTPALTNAEVHTIAREVQTADPRIPLDLLHGMIRDAFFVALSSPLFRSTVEEIPSPRSCQPVVYIAGPMTGIPEHNVPAFDAARDRLQAEGFATVSPPDITRSLGRHIEGIGADGSITEAAYRELVRLDLRELIGADVVAMLPGWRRSRGALVEYVNAVHMGLPVHTVDGLLSGARPIGPGHAIISVLTTDETDRPLLPHPST